MFPRSTFYVIISECLRSEKYPETNKSGGRKIGLFGGKRVRTPIRDTKTGAIYRSKYQAGKVLATEAGANPTDRFAWYKLISRFPERFVEVTSEKSGEAYKGGKSKVRVPQTEQNDDLSGALEAILCHKGKKMAEAALSIFSLAGNTLKSSSQRFDSDVGTSVSLLQPSCDIKVIVSSSTSVVMVISFFILPSNQKCITIQPLGQPHPAAKGRQSSRHHILLKAVLRPIPIRQESG